MSLRALTVWTALVALSLGSPAAGDKLLLADGRELEGVVTDEGPETVTILLDHGQVTFPVEQVERIVREETPREKLETKLARVPVEDADALYDVAVWAHQQGLVERARELFAEVVEIAPDHAGARRGLGQVHIDGAWQPFDKALERARSKLDAGDAEVVLDTLVAKLAPIAARRGAAADLQQLQAEAQLRAGRFAQAAESFAALAEATEGDEALRYDTIADILERNPDGMYVVQAPFPPRARLLGGDEPTLRTGPASLKRPLVLRAALHAEARKIIDRGAEMMAAARKLEAKQPSTAHLKYKQASRQFAQANALVPGIARSHRIEAVRRRIALVRREVDAEAGKLDAQIATLAKRDLAPTEWRKKLLAMIRRVDRICLPLEQVLALAEPYPRELFLEIQWAEADLKKMQAARELLTEELHGQE